MDLYRVTIGEDVYLGTAEEVVRFMARADGAPRVDGADPDAALRTYMVGIAARVGERLDVSGIETSDPQAFLESLEQKGVIRVEVQGEPSDERSDPKDVLGDGPLAFGPDTDPSDLDLG